MKGTDRYRIEGASCMYGDRVLRVGNISVGGFYVETPEPPEQGAVLKLPLSLPQRPALSIVGKVAWVNDRSHPRHSTLPPGFGFNTQRIAFNDKMTILGCLRKAEAASVSDG
jgi:Tfp pilus assembly protein PilZ